MAEVINVYAARGGQGATTCAVKLALALSLSGERTLYIDGDSVYGSGLETCSLQGINVYTLADVETGACRVKQAVLQHPASPNMYVLPSLGCQRAQTLKRAIEECKPLFDYIICDGGALTGGDGGSFIKSRADNPAPAAAENFAGGNFQAIVAALNEDESQTFGAWAATCRAILVTDPYRSSIVAARKKSGDLADGGFKQVGLMLNKVNGGLVYDGEILPPQEFATLTRLPLWGVIPEDLNLPLGKMRTDTKKAFAMTAEFIAGRSNKLFGVVGPFAGVRGILRRKMRARI